MTVIKLENRRPPVCYTVHLTDHWDGRLEIFVENVADDDRSRGSIADALRRSADVFAPNTRAGAEPATSQADHDGEALGRTVGSIPATGASISEFKNELGNTIRITIEGPTSESTNDLTPFEAAQLNELLTQHLELITPPDCTTYSYRKGWRDGYAARGTAHSSTESKPTEIVEESQS